MTVAHPVAEGRLDLARSQAIVTTFFALNGFVIANWVVCVPQVKARVDASSGALGVALLGISIGAIMTMVFAGRLCARFGTRLMLLVSATLMAIATMLPAETTHVWSLSAALFAFGAGFGSLDVAMNSRAVEIIERIGRPIMPGFHASFSIGGLAGAVVGGAVADHLGATTHLAAVGLLALFVTAALGVLLLNEPSSLAPAPARREGGAVDAEGGRARGERTALAARSRRLVMLFGLVALCSAYGEGAVGDWASLHLHLDLHTSVGFAAAGYASFSAAMILGRLSGARLLGRAGRTRVLAGGALIAASGMLLAALAPIVALVIVGFVLVGLGLANLFPSAIAGAGSLTGAAGVARASTIGYSGFLAGPPTIGFIADRIGLPAALTTISLLAAVGAGVAVIAGNVENR